MYLFRIQDDTYIYLDTVFLIRSRIKQVYSGSDLDSVRMKPGTVCSDSIRFLALVSVRFDSNCSIENQHLQEK